MLEFIAQIFRRKLMFLMALAAVAVIGASATDGWSWTTFIVSAIALFILLFAWALTSFWVWVFRNSGRPGGAR